MAQRVLKKKKGELEKKKDKYMILFTAMAHLLRNLLKIVVLARVMDINGR